MGFVDGDERGLSLGQHFRKSWHAQPFGRNEQEIQIAIDDPKSYSKPWTVTQTHELIPDSELLEYVCLENERSLSHILAK